LTEVERKLGRNEVEKHLGKGKTDTFHSRSFCDSMLPKRTVLEEDTGWIVFQKDGTTRKAKPFEVPKKPMSGVRPEDGLDSIDGAIDEAIATQLPDENESRIPKKRGVRSHV
jgi:hypothetical protein